MKDEDDDLRPEYPAELIRSGTRGKYAAAHGKGTNVALIGEDLRELFPDSESVNRALRDYVAIKRKKPDA